MPTEQEDRGKSQNGASAMAMAAAAMQQVMCMKLMAEAMEENNSEKMAMASMMCAQAAASAANAAQNKEGAKKVTLNSQMGNTPSFEKPTIETQPKADNFDSALSGLNGKNKSTEDAKKDADPLKYSSDSQTTPGTVEQQEKKITSNFSPLEISDPKQNPSSTINLKDAPNETTRTSLMGSSTPFGSLNGLNSPTGLTNLGNQSGSTAPETKGAKKNAKGTEPSGGGPAGNPEDLMARFMNAQGAFGPISAAGLGGGIIDLANGFQSSGQRPKTIFEFASEQYSKVKTTGRCLRKPTPKRAIASE